MAGASRLGGGDRPDAPAGDLGTVTEALRYELATRPNDLDALGHVNNAVALEYLEAARWDFARRLRLEASARTAAVVSRIEVDYLAQILPGSVEVTTAFSGLDADWREGLNYRVVLEQSIRSPGAEGVLVRARVSLAFVDLATGELRALQDCLKASAAEPA